MFITSQGKIISKAWDNSKYDTYIKIAIPYLILNQSGNIENSFGEKETYLGWQENQQNCDNLIVSGFFNSFDNVKKNNIVRYNLSNIITPNTPTGSTNQNFTDGQTLSNLVIDGQNILWYSNQNSCMTNNTGRNTNGVDEILSPSTLLIDGTTYYASQTIDNIESNYRLPVTVYKTLNTNNYILKNLKIYPNPFKDFLSISNNSTIEGIEVFNLLGQSIFNKRYNLRDLRIDFSSFNSGIYFVKIYSENNVNSIKIIKK